MATGSGSDLLPVRKETKARLAQLKGDASYDALLRALLDTAPREAVLRRLDVGPHPARAEPRERPPEKQLMIAELAARRWAAWIRDGRVEPRGPRLYVWRPLPAPDRKVRYGWEGRRGFAP